MLGIDPARATVLARAALAAVPTAIEPRFILGAALRRSGDPAGAGAVLNPLADARPDLWGVQYEHGMALASAGQREAGVAALRRATAANPASSLAWHALGDQLELLGASDAAAARAHRLPGGAQDAALIEIVVRLFDGDAGAPGLLRSRFGLDLNDPAAVRLVADAGMTPGRYEAVQRLLAEAATSAPDYLPLRYHLAAVLYRLDRNEEALGTLLPLRTLARKTATVPALHAAILMQCGREGEAAAAYAAALAIDPAQPQLWLGRGHALRAIGRQTDAVAAYRAAVSRRPSFGEAWWSLANLKTWRFDAADLAAMEATLASGAAMPQDRSYMHFALGKAREDEGHDAQAFGHYAAGNALRRASVPYDADGHAAFLARTVATFTPAFFAERGGVGDKGDDPIFILGMPRSGSTLVEQILASHSAVEGAGELSDITTIARRFAPGSGDAYPASLAALPRESLAMLGAEYLAHTQRRRPQGRPRFIDKFPGNFLHAGLIHLMLPNARIIDIRRHPLACCVSLFKQSFADGQAYSYDLTSLGHYYRHYAALMAHFDAVLPGRVLRISYEALVGDTEAQVRRLLDHVGLPFEPACLRFFENQRAVATPSSEQVRQPIFRNGLDQWRRFEPWLGPLKAALGPLAGHEGRTT